VYAAACENVRQQKVAVELTLTIPQKEVTDVMARLKAVGVTNRSELVLYRAGIKKLLEAAPLVQTLYQKGVGTSPQDFAKAATPKDKELFRRYGHPWCIGDVSPLCVALPNLLKRGSGVIPEGVTCDVANAKGSPFEALRQEAGVLKTVRMPMCGRKNTKNSQRF